MDRKTAERVQRFIYDGLRKTKYSAEGPQPKEKPKELRLDKHSVLRTHPDYAVFGEVTTSVLYGTSREYGELIAYLKRESAAKIFLRESSGHGGTGQEELALERRRATEGPRKDVYIIGTRNGEDQELVEDDGSRAIVDRLSKKLSAIALKTLDEIIKDEARMRSGVAI